MMYLDYNATAPVFPEVADVMRDTLCEPANASSVHAVGRKAKQVLEGARERVAHLLGVFANEVVFTASGSEANNMALRAVADRPLLVGATEHASVLKTAERWGGDTLSVDANGLVDLEVLEFKLKALGKPALVSVMLVNNETGVIQPMAEIAKLVHAYDGLVHCDAVQALGKITVDFGLLGADMMTLCGHKCGGPVGAGVLVVRNNLAVKPIVVGGGQELGRRAGTENIPAIVGLALAFEKANKREWVESADGWVRAMEADIHAAAPNAVIVGRCAPRVANVSCILMPDVLSETQLMTFDLEGICVSAGSACSSGRIEPSHVLRAMGLDEQQAACAIRVSVGWDTEESDILSFTEAWKKTYMRLAKKVA